MDNILLNRYSPVITGTPQVAREPQAQRAGTRRKGESFADILSRQVENGGPAFSKHAAERVEERGVELSESRLARLNEGVRIAEQKGLDDTLILVDSTAFLVSVRNNKVITAVGGNDLKGNVFTNIDGTVIV